MEEYTIVLAAICIIAAYTAYVFLIELYIRSKRKKEMLKAFELVEQRLKEVSQKNVTYSVPLRPEELNAGLGKPDADYQQALDGRDAACMRYLDANAWLRDRCGLVDLLCKTDIKSEAVWQKTIALLAKNETKKHSR